MVAVRKFKKGGRQPGAGRKPLTGKTRPNRVVALLDDEEIAKLESYAEEIGEPLGRAAYKILARFLKRRP